MTINEKLQQFRKEYESKRLTMGLESYIVQQFLLLEDSYVRTLSKSNIDPALKEAIILETPDADDCSWHNPPEVE